MGSKKKSKRAPRKIPGWKRLRTWISAQKKPGAAPPGWKFSLTAFAKAVGVSRQMMRHWMTPGGDKPNPEHREKLSAATDSAIRPAHWD